MDLSEVKSFHISRELILANKIKFLSAEGDTPDYVQVLGDIQTAPPAFTWLASYTVPANAKRAIIMRVMTYQSEANNMNLYWEGPGFGAKTLRVSDSAGIKMFDFDLLTKYQAGPNTTVRLFNVNPGSVGSEYQAGIWLVVFY